MNIPDSAVEAMTEAEKAAWNGETAPQQLTPEQQAKVADDAIRTALGITTAQDVQDRERALARDKYVGMGALTARPSMGRRRMVQFPGMSAFIRTQLEKIPAGAAVARADLTDAIVNHFAGCNRTKAGVSLEFALQRAWAQPYRKMTHKQTGMVYIANQPTR